jgi:predicted dehydrogenase
MAWMTIRYLLFFAATLAFAQNSDSPLRVVVVGLNHGHVDGFFGAVKNRQDVQVVGIFDPDTDLQKHYAQKFGYADALFATDLGALLDRTKPEAIAIFTSTDGHGAAVEAAAKRHIDAMMEKPLAVNMVQARRIEHAATASGIHVIVNYETTWYPSHAELRRRLEGTGEIRKMMAMDGHEGPKEIHVGPEFFDWLTNPLKNGAGALFDFGCYGANLMTWMMNNERPLAVTAITQTDKPAIYQRVDDEATVLVEYPKAQGIIQGSWNWPFARKDFEVYTEHAYAIADGGKVLRARAPGPSTEETLNPPPLPPDEKDSVSYLRAVVRGKVQPSGLSSLANNMIVVEILDAARESARTGHIVKLQPRQ